MKPSLRSLAAAVGRTLTARKLTIATAESMTGGAIAAACTSIAGSSSWFECAFVTYRLSAKTAILGVERASIEQHGVVSEFVARAMAEGALARCGAHIAVSTTGVAGPGTDEFHTSVGDVWFAWAVRSNDRVATVRVAHRVLSGSRHEIRQSAVHVALEGVIEIAADIAP